VLIVGRPGTTSIYGYQATTHLVEVERILKGVWFTMTPSQSVLPFQQGTRLPFHLCRQPAPIGLESIP
jgi:hypothetical protein